MSRNPILGGIEAGGSKFVCAVGTGPQDLRAEIRIPTTTPTDTLDRAVSFFESAERRFGAVAGIGVGCFGPVDPDPSSTTFGRITSTPKAGWADTDVAGPLSRRFGVPVGFDTDVNGAALGEHRWGAARGVDTFIYLTVGTGIGGGGMVGGRLLRGLVHPEMGHVIVRHDPSRDPFPGLCPFHADCLEGLASGPAIQARWGRPGQELSDRPEVWELEADYLAQALATYLYVLSPRRIVLGGGVMRQPGLLALVRYRLKEVVKGYIRHPLVGDEIENYVVEPGLGGRSGVLGAMALAEAAILSTGISSP